MESKYNQTSPLVYIKGLHRQTDGYITFFKKLEDNQVKQYHYKLEEITEDLLKDWVDYDTYISLNSFFIPKRGNVHLRKIYNLYVDLDCYNVGMSPEEVLVALNNDFFGSVLPVPNMVLHSGRGLGLIWHIEAISGLAIERWMVVQRAIDEQLKQFGADSSVTTDASRVFRLPASVNSKSNEIVRYDVLHEEEYSLKELGQKYFGIVSVPGFEKMEVGNEQPVLPNKKKKAVSYMFNGYTLVKARLEDIERLIKVRKGEVNGYRERLLFLARYYALKVSNNEEAAIRKIEYLNGLFVVPLSDSEVLGATFSAVTYYKEGTGINISNTTLINWFDITREEQKELATIISKAEKRERGRIRKEQFRRATGMESMAAYNARRLKVVIRHVKRLKLIISIYPNDSIRKLADRFGMSKSYVNNLLKRMDELLLTNFKQLSTHLSPLVMGGGLLVMVQGMFYVFLAGKSGDICIFDCYIGAT